MKKFSDYVDESVGGRKLSIQDMRKSMARLYDNIAMALYAIKNFDGDIPKYANTFPDIEKQLIEVQKLVKGYIR